MSVTYVADGDLATPANMNSWLNQSAANQYNVGFYGAVGDGVTDDTSAIQDAIDACFTAGGGVVTIPAGTFLVSVSAHPQAAGYFAGIRVKDGVTLAGAGKDSTTIKLAASQQGRTSGGISVAVVYNHEIADGGDEIHLRDMTIDGNAANNTSADSHMGVHILRGVDCSFTRVRVKNVRGTDISGYAESFGFDYGLSSNGSFTDCEAIVDSGESSSGFSANSSVMVRYVNCFANGHTVAHGFTHNACRSIQYVGCVSILNALYGFNSEVSDDITYDGCVAGGTIPSSFNPHPYTALDDLGNTSAGFVTSQCTGVSYLGCHSRDNGTQGFWFANSSTNITVVGGLAASNGDYGLSCNGSTSITVLGLRYSGNATGATSGPFSPRNGVVTLPTAGAVTSVVVTHDLGATPDLQDISVTPIEAWGSSTQFWVTTPTATQFTINVNVAPGQDVDFAWTASIQ